MKYPYREAARMIAEDEEFLCCYALYEFDLRYIGKFRKYFKPRNNLILWWGPSLYPKNQLARSLALLLMHEMQKDGIL